MIQDIVEGQQGDLHGPIPLGAAILRIAGATQAVQGPRTDMKDEASLQEGKHAYVVFRLCFAEKTLGQSPIFFIEVAIELAAQEIARVHRHKRQEASLSWCVSKALNVQNGINASH